MQPPIIVDNAEAAVELFKDIECIICDCDGVLWTHDLLLEGSDIFINNMRKKGKQIIFATNNSTASRQSVLAKLNRLGFNASLNEIMVTSYSVGLYLKKQHFSGKVYVIGSSALRTEIENAGFKVTPTLDQVTIDKDTYDDQGIVYSEIKVDPDVSAVVIGYDCQLTVTKLIKACSYAQKVSPELFIATNHDTTYPTHYSKLTIPGTGAYAQMVEHVVEKKSVSVGKPTKFFFDCIKSIHPDLDASKCIMIGDRLDSDIEFGRNNNIKHCLLVGTGVHKMANRLTQNNSELSNAVRQSEYNAYLQRAKRIEDKFC